MVRILATFLLLALCPVSFLAQELPAIARAMEPSAQWTKEGFLELSFALPSSVRVPFGSHLRVSPVYMEKGRELAVFPSVVYLGRSEKRYYLRRNSYKNEFDIQKRDILLTPSDSAGKYIYCDTIAAGGLKDKGIVEFRYYYSECCEEMLLATDRMDVPSGRRKE